jgi:nitrogenase-stabilizing/protective protein
MRDPDELAGLESAEEFFERLGVPFDPAVLRRARLHVLRAFGLLVAQIDSRRPSPAERRRLYADALGRAHSLYASAGAPRAPGGGCGGCRVAAACGER